jgi:hypothetical protein
MIAIVKMKSKGTGTKTFKKAMIRDRVFHEVDDSNKKIKDGQLNLKEIEGVISLVDKKFTVVDTDKFLEEAHSKMFWGAA